MYIHIGTAPYGTCDVVPELFYVATWFGHFDFIPLIPMHSNLVVAKHGNQYQVVKIPLSFRSIFLAWARLGSFALALGIGIMGVMAFADNGGKQEAYMTWLVAGFFAIVYGFLMIYPRRKMPSYARACKLAQLANLSDTGWAALNVLYGRDPFDRPTAPGETIPIR